MTARLFLSSNRPSTLSGKWRSKPVSVSQLIKNRQQANLLPVLSPSPICDIDRTFTHIFFLKPKNTTAKTVNHFYSNPICLANQYKHLIDSGEVKNQTDLALKLGVSKVRVCNVLSLLKLNGELVEAVEKIGDPMPSRIVSIRMLRECLKSPDVYKSLLSLLNNFKK